MEEIISLNYWSEQFYYYYEEESVALLKRHSYALEVLMNLKTLINKYKE